MSAIEYATCEYCGRLFGWKSGRTTTAPRECGSDHRLLRLVRRDTPLASRAVSPRNAQGEHPTDLF